MAERRDRRLDRFASFLEDVKYEFDADSFEGGRRLRRSLLMSGLTSAEADRAMNGMMAEIAAEAKERGITTEDVVKEIDACEDPEERNSRIMDLLFNSGEGGYYQFNEEEEITIAEIREGELFFSRVEFLPDTAAEFSNYFSDDKIARLADQHQIKKKDIWDQRDALAAELAQPYWLKLALEEIFGRELLLPDSMMEEEGAFGVLEEEEEVLTILSSYGLAAFDGANGFIPPDIRENYWDLMDQGFDFEMEQKQWILRCMAAVRVLYGEVPFKVFREMVQVKEDMDVEEEQMELLALSADDDMDYEDGILFSETFRRSEAYRKIMERQQGYGYRIPGEPEILNLARYGWPRDLPSFAAVKEYIIHQVPDFDPLMADAVNADLFDAINATWQMQEKFQAGCRIVMDCVDVLPEDEKEYREIRELVTEVVNTMPHRDMRGNILSDMGRRIRMLSES